ncbi:MAG TPA: hypothetical protein VN026_01505 [Bacteroidia bacterium]|nr:hypothetical protein [Bacteroidia bacterium]
MCEYEIKDNSGTLFLGDFVTMLLAWNVNRLDDDTFEKMYGVPKKVWNQYELNKWEGRLKLCIVIESLPCRL